jgi:uncharacterized membrane protein YhhN
MIFVLVGLFIVSWFIFIYHVVTNKRLEGFFYKGFTSFLFIAIAIYGAFHFMTTPPSGISMALFEFKYARLILLIILGLVSGLIGDLFLEVQYFFNEKRIFTINKGMIIFLIGHLLYIVGIINYTKFNYIALIIGLMMTVVVYIGGKLMDLKMGKLEVMTYIYTFVIFTMVGFSVLQAIDLSFNLYSLSFMIGAILFGISDLLLAPIYFKDEKSNVFVVSNLATYYLGQLLIALSIFFL